MWKSKRELYHKKIAIRYNYSYFNKIYSQSQLLLLARKVVRYRLQLLLKTSSKLLYIGYFAIYISCD